MVPAKLNGIKNTHKLMGSKGWWAVTITKKDFPHSQFTTQASGVISPISANTT